jgi:hypothetical protein
VDQVRISKPSPALVVALVALFVALGGVGYAASKIDTADIENGAVTAKKLHKRAVTSAKVRNGGIRAPDLAPGVIPEPKVTVRTGGTATAGANGTGPGCVDGVPAGSKGYRDANNVLVNGGCGGGAGGSSTQMAECKANEVATGGGYTFQDGKRHALVAKSVPSPTNGTPTAWQIKVETLTNDSSNNTPVTPYVICMRP